MRTGNEPAAIKITLPISTKNILINVRNQISQIFANISSTGYASCVTTSERAMTPGCRRNPYKAENTNHNGNDLKKNANNKPTEDKNARKTLKIAMTSYRL